MEKKKLAFIEVAAVWFGTHAGGGFATGNQTKNFFVVGGKTAKSILISCGARLAPFDQ